MEDWTALSDDYFRDFAKKCELPQEKLENKDIEDTNLENSFLQFVIRFFLTINPEGVQVLLKLSFQIVEFYQVMLIRSRIFHHKFQENFWRIRMNSFHMGTVVYIFFSSCLFIGCCNLLRREYLTNSFCKIYYSLNFFKHKFKFF